MDLFISITSNEQYTIKVICHSAVFHITGIAFLDIANAAAKGIKENCKDVSSVSVFYAGIDKPSHSTPQHIHD